MPRMKKTDAQRRAEKFAEYYRIGKARLGFTEEQLSSAMGVTPPTLLAKRKDPCKRFVFGEVVLLSDIMGWTDEEILSLFRPAKKQEDRC